MIKVMWKKTWIKWAEKYNRVYLEAKHEKATNRRLKKDIKKMRDYIDTLEGDLDDNT